MSNQNMSWNQFLTEFVLRAMTNNIHEEYFSPDDAARLARKAWNAIRAAQIKTLATSALVVSKDKAKWLAVDADGEVWAFDVEPTVHESKAVWDNSDAISWQLCDVAPPVNFTAELYEISKILNNE